MNYIELSNEFDILSNKFSLENSIPLQMFDEYEKSVFVTMAAEQIVNSILPFYDKNEFVRKALDDLTVSAVMTPESINSGIEGNSIIFLKPSDLLVVVYSKLYSGSKGIMVIPVMDDSRDFNINNPFRMPNADYALRVDNHSGPSIELIVNQSYNSFSVSYKVKYIKKVPAFILAETTFPATIGGVSTNPQASSPAPLELLHNVILSKAVLLAQASRGADVNTKKFIEDLNLGDIKINL